MTLLHIVLATLFISAGSFVAIFTLALKQSFLAKILKSLIAIAAGTMLGATFFHLLPEAAQFLPATTYLQITLASFIAFYLIEKIFHWRHCHDDHCTRHSFGAMNLIGDGLHNFIDGMVIAGAFLVDTTLGITTTLAIALHEIPQEIGDFGVLLYAGYTKRKAMLANVIVALTSVLGGVLGFFLFSQSQLVLQYLLPIAAGGFLYIATSDLLPELRAETRRKQMVITFLAFLLGIAVMWFAGESHSHEEYHHDEHRFETT